MEWVIVNPGSIHEICGLLGHFDGNGEYMIKETCTESIDNLLSKLSHDGPSLRTRRILGQSQTVHKDFVPLLNAASLASHKVVPKLLKLLSYLTSPIECLIPSEFTLTEEGAQVVFEVDSLLKSIKSEFADYKVTQSVVEFLKRITSKTNILSKEACEQVSDGLLLLRNLLHIPHPESQVQNQILWNLFAHGLDKFLIHLMTCEQKGLWAIPLVQLIALIYKDQHVQNLQKLLHLWLENSMSESSEDNESNTSPKDQEESCDSSSPILTSSDPTNSDSSESGGEKEEGPGIGGKKAASGDAPGPSAKSGPPSGKDHGMGAQQQKCYTKSKTKTKGSSKEKQSDADSGILSILSQTITSDTKSSAEESCDMGGYSKENMSYKVDCTSTSSNEDEQHQQFSRRAGKPSGTHSLHPKVNQKLRIPSMKGSSLPTISPQDRHEMKRKKLHKRAKRTRTNMKALVHHNPTEEDISHVLREFTVDFLLKGYASLVSLLQEQLCGNASLQMDKSHFLWLITYFLKFASQLELDLEHISPVLSYELLSYLTFEGVAMSENLSLCKDDLKPHLRRMHLVVTAIREFVQAVEIYSKMPSYSHEEKVHLKQLQSDMLNVVELRSLFLLLIRQFRPGVQSKQYLQDLITTNHVFLLLLEKASSQEGYTGNFCMLDFIKEFSSPVVIQQYGNLLEDFKKNGEFVNDCIFTMIHHIAGDLNLPEALCQPLILKTFSHIWEVEFEIKDDWADLIEYVIQRFMIANNEEKKMIFKSGTSNVSDDSGWTKEDIENLYWLYSSSAKANDPIASILDAYKESGSGNGKSRESVLNQLLHQRIIGYNQFLRFLSWERVEAAEPNGASVCDVSSSTCSSLAMTGGPSTGPKSPSPPTSTVLDRAGFSLGCSGMESTECNVPSSTSTSSAAAGGPVELTSLDISVAELITQLVSEGQDLEWLQKQVLEACFVKIRLEDKERRLKDPGAEIEEKRQEDGRSHVTEPVPHHYASLGRSIPIIPWTKWQEIALMSPPYILLLHKLGFHLPADVGQIFPRIPHFWTADVLFSVATKLGSLPPPQKMKFDPARISEVDPESLRVERQGLAIPSSIMREESGAEFSLPGVGVGNSFLQGHAAYGFGAKAHSVNWINLVHKSMQLSDRHSESVDITSTTTESEHMDDCASLKALPPTDISEDVTMLSAPDTDTDGEVDEEDDEEEDEAKVQNPTPSSSTPS